MTISIMTMQALNRAIDKALGVHIYDNNHFEQAKGKAMQFGVNWSAMGTVSADEALEYAKKIEKAANLCKVLNHAEIRVDYDREVLETREQYGELVEELEQAISCEFHPEYSLGLILGRVQLPAVRLA